MLLPFAYYIPPKHSILFFYTAVKGTIRGLTTGSLQWNPAIGIMCASYGTIFATANSVRVACKQTSTNPVIPMAIATWGINTVAMTFKDRSYAMLLNPNAAKAVAFPTSSLMLFGARDAFTISAAFIFKEQVCRL